MRFRNFMKEPVKISIFFPAGPFKRHPNLNLYHNFLTIQALLCTIDVVSRHIASHHLCRCKPSALCCVTNRTSRRGHCFALQGLKLLSCRDVVSRHRRCFAPPALFHAPSTVLRHRRCFALPALLCACSTLYHRDCFALQALLCDVDGASQHRRCFAPQPLPPDAGAGSRHRRCFAPLALLRATGAALRRRLCSEP